MNHWISLVNVAEVDQYVEIAKHAEELGYDAAFVDGDIAMLSDRRVADVLAQKARGQVVQGGGYGGVFSAQHLAAYGQGLAQ